MVLRFTHVLVVTATCGCGTRSDVWRPFSVDSVRSRAASQRPVLRDSRILVADGERLGRDSGRTTFGVLSDLRLRGDGGLVGADPFSRRVLLLSSRDSDVRLIGRAGSALGEFQAPSSIDVRGSRIAVLDDRLGRVSVFDTSGVHLWSLEISIAVPLHSVSFASDASFFLSVIGDTVQVYRLDSLGSITGSFVHTPPVARTFYRGIRGGEVCSKHGQGVYANPLMNELVFFGIGAERIVRREDSFFRPLWVRDEDGRQPGSTAVLLRILCLDSYVLVASLKPRGQRLVYEFWSYDGEPAMRLEMSEAAGPYPGVPAGFLGGRLISYRSLPQPRVLMFRADSLAAAN